MSQLIDQDKVRFPGSGSAVSGSTCFHFFDGDAEFTADCYAAMIWASRRLGYPIVDIEMIDVDFYACFEEAVLEAGAQINQFNIRNNLALFQGQIVESLGNLSGRAVVGTPMNYIIELAEAYGGEIGTGGEVDWKRGSLTTVPFQQSYDLQALWGDVSESFNRIEIKRIFHERPPAFARIYDPMSMTGMSYSNVLNEMGFGAYSPAVQFLMTPIFEDLLRGQAIEFNDTVRKSAYSFEIINNKLKLFPIPEYSQKVYFDYILKNDRYSGSVSPYVSASFNSSGSLVSGSGYVSDYGDIPYQNPIYSRLNDVIKQWIRKYFLALCKELLGAVRQKYQTIPIPGGEVTLDGAELRSEAREEKDKLVTELRENLAALAKTQQTEDIAKQAEQLNQTLKYVPLMIYIG